MTVLDQSKNETTLLFLYLSVFARSRKHQQPPMRIQWLRDVDRLRRQDGQDGGAYTRARIGVRRQP